MVCHRAEFPCGIAAVALCLVLSHTPSVFGAPAFRNFFLGVILDAWVVVCRKNLPQYHLSLHNEGAQEICVDLVCFAMHCVQKLRGKQWNTDKTPHLLSFFSNISVLGCQLGSLSVLPTAQAFQ